MTITKAAEADKLELKVAGRLDTSTAPQLEKDHEQAGQHEGDRRQ